MNTRSLFFRRHPSFFRSTFSADEAHLHEKLSSLPDSEQLLVESIWRQFQTAAKPLREIIIDGILHESCLSQLSYITSSIELLTKVDFITSLPTEVSYQILRYLDGKSLCHCAQVSRRWRAVSDDDAIWHRMCTQHIDRKCTKCGWGLPLMPSTSKRPVPAIGSSAASVDSSSADSPPDTKRLCRDPPSLSNAAHTIIPLTADTSAASSLVSASRSSTPASSFLSDPASTTLITPAGPGTCSPISSHTTSGSPCLPSLSPEASPIHTPTPADQNNLPVRRRYRRPWKEVYAERLIVERNWRGASFTVKNLSGHVDGIMALWYDDCSSILVTGGYDHTLRAWSVDTGECLAVMSGHTQCVRGVQFDGVKIISCSMDRTLRIWSTQSFACLRVVVGHNDGVVCLHFTETILSSGSVDGVIRVTDLTANKTCSFNGHTDCVNKVLILPCRKKLLSCSDDSTARLWDIESRTTLRVFTGHVGPVQCLQLAFPRYTDGTDVGNMKIVTGSLDHTIKIWDFTTGQPYLTLFGHVEGVWCVDVDSLRIVSGSHDGTLKVWDIESGKCMYTLGDSSDLINCCSLSDTRIISGGENGMVKIRDFLHSKSADNSSGSSSVSFTPA
ncbi:hypothetical protein BASA50_001559 [Batrachochytrium salamandrivorans]|uniref:F-box domain-containing protein n=1 Tax=Batrachochytrium salamandrivorans TaxID=1357716 RepID=A0ABQ8FNX1_9FUNG|nr:hypothetical protein BASA62_003608 [Batrachochytrium salamandrivorans]KAH6573006.1 hypothetical protein BASA60_006277 [Batrachochytrium salamandrivorans]KAH6597591.1 hypothetical protein BASA61_003091 [Batrachochytrium salamandrivorans]KAH6601521.1 hypothetical protein BASA50_001559 [Batrachochytrium salamandrivorans]KAH9249930.1 hypothetical protein BASA81_012307 [Batrachochytrium salamandrivorans]